MDTIDNNKIMPIEVVISNADKTITIKKVRTLSKYKRCTKGKRRNKKTHRCRIKK
jgi:hypothetical protein